MRFRVAEDEAGQRLDRVVAARASLSRADLRALFEAGDVRRQGRRAKRGARVEAGDEIEVAERAVLSVEALPDPDVEVDVRFEDDSLLIVDKPAGLPSHPLRAGEKGCLANGLLARFPELAGVGYEPRQPGLVNRLDNHTSGLLIVARSADAFAVLRRRLSEGRIHKRYLAACDTLPDRHALRWFLGPDPRDERRMVCEDERPGLENARLMPAVSDVVCEALGPSGTFVTVRAHRALRHQVRCHLAAAGAPICGDTLYGGRLLPCGHHLLHACEVGLPHPRNSHWVRVQSPRPAAWAVQLRTESTAPPAP